jgi:hypothetical protein
MRLVGDQQGLGLGVYAPNQGQCKGKDVAVCERRWQRGRPSVADGAPGGVAPGAKGTFPLGGFPRKALTRAAARRPGRSGGAAVASSVRAQPGTHTPTRRRKKVCGGKDKGD